MKHKEVTGVEARLNSSHWLIGHNSAGLAMDDEKGLPKLAEPSVGIAIADLVQRATTIQEAHLAAQRKTLTAYTIRARPSRKVGEDNPTKKKRKKHKEA